MISARGDKAWGECGRCGQRVLLRSLISDGYVKNLLVERACYEPPEPQEVLPPMTDPISVAHPSPSNNHEITEVKIPNFDLTNNMVNSSINMAFHLGMPTLEVI